MTKREAINLCLEWPDTMEAYPFHLMPEAPEAWAAVQHKANKKTIAFISIHKGQLIINLKCNPFEAEMFRQMFKDCTPGYHMNKEHWNTIVPDGDVPLNVLKEMINHSYELTKPKQKIKNKNIIIETDRLYLREMAQGDYPALCKILQDKEVMYAYEHAFSDEEAQNWLNKQLKNYADYGFGLWAVILKSTNEMIGQCGLTMQDYKENKVLEVGYLFQKAYWHKGYATEAAIACKDYAFNKLKADEVFSIIRDTNIASQNVAKRNGMKVCGEFIKHYYDMDMPHLLFSVRREK